MRNVMDRQADINRKIANLLILIRRYGDDKEENDRKATQIALQLQNLLQN